MPETKEQLPYNNNLFSHHFLQERLGELDEWQEAEIEEKLEQLREIWQQKKQFLRNNPNEDNTQEEFINPILQQVLGHHFTLEEQKEVSGETLNPDYLFFKDLNEQLDAEEDEDQDLFDKSYAVGDAKRWKAELDRSSTDHTNPAFQIYNYVDRLRANWGVLTNGKRWRLYSYEDCEADTFYEVDIVEDILEESDEEQALENFRYFYLFFRQESFLPKGDGFLEQVFEGSVTYAKGLEEDLEDKIYTALEVTARGFFETNDLEQTEEMKEKVHHASLIFLYRLLFILNAESRGLLPVEDGSYRQAFGLTGLKQMLEDDPEENHLFQENTIAWDNRLSRLFEGIDDGYELDEARIPAYNGGLFNDEEHEFLAENKLRGDYLYQVMKLLAQSEDEETGEKVLVDYQDLNIRHLGSVYEGLLEHELDYASQRLILENGEWQPEEEADKAWESAGFTEKVREGEVYVTNESGERKATGSYYTPEYVVEYIVENTVGPKVEEKIEQADNKSDVLKKVLELDVCDPAMGSGHFLTETTSYIAHKIIEHGSLRDEEVEDGNELVWVKRQVVKRCIYGVDINPLATELAKLSLWIETMSRGKPLNFLDHHLKIGNSLVGSEFDEILTHPFNDEQKTLENDRFEFGSPEDAKETLKQRYRKIEEMPEESLEEIKKKEEAYREFIQNDQLYNQFKKVANVHTHQFFGGEVDTTQYENLLVNSVGTPSFEGYSEDSWFRKAQEDAEQKSFFHWELEYPKVFFGDNAGFDAVIGNPPYVRMEQIKPLKPYLSENYTVHDSRVDLYGYFIEKSLELTEDLYGVIVSNKWMKAGYGAKIRGLLSQYDIEQLINFGDLEVFDGVSTYPLILIVSKQQRSEKVEMLRVEDLDFEDLSKRVEKEKIVAESYFDDEDIWKIENPEERSLKSKIEDIGRPLHSWIDENVEENQVKDGMGWGIKTGGNDAFIISEKKKEELISKDSKSKEIIRPLIKGNDIKRYSIDFSDRYLIYCHKGIDIDEYPAVKEHLSNYKEDIGDTATDEEWYELMQPQEEYQEYFESKKIVYPDISKGVNFAYDKQGYYLANTCYFLPSDSKELLGILNSSLIDWFYKYVTSQYRGGYQRSFNNAVKNLPVKTGEGDNLEELVDSIVDYKARRNKLNLRLRDYLGNYSEGEKLGTLYTPADGVSDTALTQTADDLEKLQVGGTETERNGDSLTLLVSARYKPENEESYETDQYGYTETELYPAMEFHGLSEKQMALIEEFVPVAVEEAGGFAGFRSKATKTKSLIDRLKNLTLPKVSDVEDDLERFIEEKQKAEELERKIEETDQKIDEIVYDLYELTEEEIQVVEKSV